MAGGVTQAQGVVANDPTIAAITGGNTWFVPTGGTSYVGVSCPSDVTEDTLATITIPALSANAKLRITTKWTYTNSANNKTIRIKLGGTQFAGFVQTTTAGAEMICEIANVNALNVQAGNGWLFTASAISFAAAMTAGAIDTSATSNLTITGQKALNTETLTLDGYTVEVLKP